MSKRIRRAVISALQIALLAYLGYGALLFLFQRQLMYPGTRLSAAPVDAIPEDAERLELDTSSGTVEVWWFAAEAEAPSPAIVFAHGNAELIEDNAAMARRLRALGVGVLLVEYPGFGRSEGTPTRASIGETFTLAYDRLVRMDGVDPDRIVGMGRSLGGGAITDLATARELRALILQSTYTSVADMAFRGYLMPGFLVKDAFDNAAVLQRFEGPVLILHGTEDRVIDFGHAERLAALSGDVRLVALECGHNDCAWTSDEIVVPIREFLREAEVLER